MAFDGSAARLPCALIFNFHQPGAIVHGGLPNLEVEHDGYEHVHRCAGETTRLEAPLRHGCDGLLVESIRIQRSNHSDLRWTTFARDDKLQHDGALNFVQQGVGRVGRPDLRDDTGRGDRAPRPIGSATAKTAAESGAYARSTTGSDAGAGAGTDAAAGAGTARCAGRHSTGRKPNLIEAAGPERLRIEDY